MSDRMRRPVLAVVGDGLTVEPAVLELARRLGRLAVDAGFRVLTGGLAGVMEAASEGARSSAAYREGDVIGVLPGSDAATANEFVDIALPTGMGIARNVLVVAAADVVVAVGGGSGTLTEIAMAWQMDKPVVSMVSSGGWAAKLADTAIDPRARPAIIGAVGPDDAIRRAQELVALPRAGARYEDT